MEYWLKFAHWVYDMQSLIAGLLALIAAFITMFYLRRQLKQSSEFRQADIYARHTSTKTEAIWSLMQVSNYCSDCLEYLKECDAQKSTYKHVSPESCLGKPPEFPDKSLSLIASLTEGLNRPSQEKIQNYIAHIQIQFSRMKDLRDALAERNKMPSGIPVHDPTALPQAVLDYYVLNYQTNRVLGYCRGDYDEIPSLPSKDDFKNEISKFPNILIDTTDTDYVLMLWPESGWWRVKA